MVNLNSTANCMPQKEKFGNRLLKNIPKGHMVNIKTVLDKNGNPVFWKIEDLGEVEGLSKK